MVGISRGRIIAIMTTVTGVGRIIIVAIVAGCAIIGDAGMRAI